MIQIAAVLGVVIPGCISGYFVWKKYRSVLFTLAGFCATAIFISLFYIVIFLLSNKLK